MLKEYNRKSFYWGIPGITLQIIAGVFLRNPANSTIASLRMVIILIGTMLLLAGLVFYVLAKGRHPAWCLMGVFSVIGFAVLLLLKDKTLPVAEASDTTRQTNTQIQEDKGRPSLLIICAIVVVWLGLTAALAVWLHDYELSHFDCNNVASIVLGFLFMGSITACPAVMVLILLTKRIVLWLRIVLAFFAFVFTSLVATVTGILWLSTHMCP